jgi:hypothetical protein
LKFDINGEIPYCSTLGTSPFSISPGDPSIQSTNVIPADSSAESALVDISVQENDVITSTRCPGLTSEITLKDVSNNVLSDNFDPGLDIRYKVQFVVNFDPSKKYRVAARCKAFSLYKPDGNNYDWTHVFPAKRRILYGGEYRAIRFDAQIPSNAVTSWCRLRLILNLEEYDEGTETWNLLWTYWEKKRFEVN